MDAKPSSINDILYMPETYVIPVFQRYYEWENKQLKQLWQDILSIYENRAEAFSHFIGPFVFISHSSPSSTHHLIIDGQQRLITISLIFAALRDLAKEKGITSSSTYANQYLFFNDADGIQKMKLNTRATDRETFKKILEENHSRIDKTSNIFKTYSFFKKKIESLVKNSDSEASVVFKELLNAITRQLQLVEVTLNPTDNPSNIYQSLNFKGKKLSEADLIRNYIFMQLPIDEQDTFNTSVWRNFEDMFIVENQLNSKQVEDFYYRFLIYKKGYFARLNLYAEFSSFVSEETTTDNNDQANLEGLVNLLKEFAEYYLNIDELAEPNEDIRKALSRIKKLNIATVIPFILSLYSRYNNKDQDNSISQAEFIAYMQAVESFVIRRSFLRLRTRGYGLDFADAIKKSSTIDSLRAYFIAKGWPTDDEIREVLQTFKIYIHEKKKAEVILKEIELGLGHREKVILDELTIEHILPQALTDEWRDMLGDNADLLHEKYVHTIGNLTLTGYNDKLKNLPFADKKEILTESKLSVNKHFENIDSWGEAQIVSQTKWISKQIGRYWPRPKQK